MKFYDLHFSEKALYFSRWLNSWLLSLNSIDGTIANISETFWIQFMHSVCTLNAMQYCTVFNFSFSSIIFIDLTIFVVTPLIEDVVKSIFVFYSKRILQTIIFMCECVFDMNIYIDVLFVLSISPTWISVNAFAWELFSINCISTNRKRRLGIGIEMRSSCIVANENTALARALRAGLRLNLQRTCINCIEMTIGLLNRIRLTSSVYQYL